MDFNYVDFLSSSDKNLIKICIMNHLIKMKDFHFGY